MSSWRCSPAPSSPQAAWRRICDQPGDDCVSIPGAPGLVHDEGTFNIFLHEGGYYYVSFHGYDGARGYRGIARTRDFACWDAGDPSLGVPADAVLDARDQEGWREDWLPGGPIASVPAQSSAKGSTSISSARAPT
ncbi:MAG: hypothetical protein IPG96_12600 [Proteobacteria bacterium]|nr:hypothetical protein [Pseudomonadota bacterium]